MPLERKQLYRSTLTLSVLREPAEVMALRASWLELWAETDLATPFQSPQWLLAYFHSFPSAEHRIVTVRDGERLVGLAAFTVTEDSGGSRCLRLLGTGISDYLDILAAPGFEFAAGNLILAWIRQECVGRTSLSYSEISFPASVESERMESPRLQCDLQQLRSESPLLILDAGEDTTDRVETQDPCPLLHRNSQGEWEIPAAFLKKLSYEERRLETLGGYRVERADFANFPRLFDALLHLHHHRWRERGESGVLADHAVQRMHEIAAAELLAHGALRLYCLFHYDTPVASYYGFFHQRQAYYYLGGFDPEYERLSVGNQVIFHALREAQAENALTFDFLRGQEPYKYRWGARDRQTYRRVLRPQREPSFTL